MERVEVGGMTIAYRQAGRGEPLILLHGGISDGRDWRPQMRELSTAFRVVAWDAPGCGRSSDPPDRFRLPEYADCLAGFISALELQRPHVLGLSFGAGLALELYRRQPSLTRSLVLASAYAGWKGSLPEDEVARRLEGALRDAEKSPDDLVAEWIPTLFCAPATAEMLEEAGKIIADSHPAGIRAMAHAFAEADLRDVLPTIRVPTLLLYGEEDVRAPKTVAYSLHDAIPGSRLVFIPSVGHMCNLEAPARFNDEVMTFLRSVTAESS